MDIPAHEVGLPLASSNTMSNSVYQVYDLPISKKCAAVFMSHTAYRLHGIHC